MPPQFNKKSPESYLAGLRRKDSKNALTTCHGVTDKGRACRRALASPKNSSNFDGAVVITGNAEDPAVFFCWQHKDQAEYVIGAGEGSVVSLKGRHSLEDAFRSLGLEDVDEECDQAGNSPSPQPLLAAQVQIPEPTVTVATDFAHGHSSPVAIHEKERYPHERSHRRRRESRTQGATREKPHRRRSDETRPQNSRSSFSLFSCCFGAEPAPKRHGQSRSNRDRYPPVRPAQPLNLTTDRRQYAPSTVVEDSCQRYKVEAASYDAFHISSNGERGLPKTPAGVRRKDMPSHRKVDSGYAMNATPNTEKMANPRRRSDFNVYRDASPTPASRPIYQANPKSDSLLLKIPAHRPLQKRTQSTPDAQQIQRLHAEWPPPLPRTATDATRLIYAKLLTAMSEPPSKSDTPGFIYIFWQTNVQQTDDETSAVASIISLAPDLPDHQSGGGLQRQETILQRRFFQTSANARLPRPRSRREEQEQEQEQEQRTLFLKIGRAANVHQRLNQWRKQCEYDISLLRSYPYDAAKHKSKPQKTSPAGASTRDDRGGGSSSSSAGKPVPYVVKVERLIHLHLEMLGQRVSRACRCGTEHREWFEVPATTRGVREVDEIVRRWVGWSEERFGSVVC